MKNGAIAGQTILDMPDRILINGEEFLYSSPTTRAVIEFSVGIEDLPRVNTNEDNSITYTEMLAKAAECSCIGRIIAKLIVGKYEHKKYIERSVSKPKWWTFRQSKGATEEMVEEPYFSVVDRLDKALMEEVTPVELHQLFLRLLKRMQIEGFSELFFSLNEINLLRPTKTTAVIQSGQSLEG